MNVNKEPIELKRSFILKRWHLNALCLVLGLVVLLSCKNNQKQGSELSNDDLFEVDEVEETQSHQMNYRIPIPIDLFIVLENSGALFVEEAMNSPLKRAQYSSMSSKAINFGVYSSDLAYCSVFGDFQGSLVYFNTAKDLSVDLGLYEGYGEEMAYRINNNLSNIDSLINISTDIYYQATTYLSDEGMADVMSLIMTGCWIESIYIIVESITDFDVNDPLVERVADQQFLLDNLLELVESNKSDITSAKVLNNLLELQEVYDQLYFNSDDVIITKQQYVSIVNKIREVRENFVQ